MTITRTSPNAQKTGFTLIELLVVIAIISLLVSILLPSLSKAKDLAKSTICQTRLRSLGTSMQMYLNECNGMYPRFDVAPNDSHLPTWQLYVMWAMGEASTQDLQYPQCNDSLWKNPEVFHCPSDVNTTFDGPSDWDYTWSYGGNQHLGNLPGAHEYLSADQVHEPARVFILSEAGGYTENSTSFGGWNSINVWCDVAVPGSLMQWIVWRHPIASNPNEPWLDGGFNVLFCDGHVENQKYPLDYWQFVP